MNDNIKAYLASNIPERNFKVQQMEEYAQANRIPIMDPVSIHFVQQLLYLNKPRRILEIGTAIGYSAIRMIEASPKAKLVTIERDEVRYNEAVNNVRTYGLQEQIQIIFGDALEELKDLQNDELFDVILIDAAKGQYRRFFELSSPLLTENGIIITDNVLFRGYVAQPELTPPRYKKMVEKLISYNEWLMHNPGFTTSIVPVGDGIAISIKQT
ncbi:O-methyltransferase [Virgibacillus proomii]|uniref:O-methyltransferase n=1 Tax=Virgibacillus proomii TaxID=84407 RepID=UPI001C10FFE3|nr:O-methyltransferase [Virgibacillus proomii]MBU5265820.1 O-methyltransferase [Virgibacillus proomii]